MNRICKAYSDGFLPSLVGFLVVATAVGGMARNESSSYLDAGCIASGWAIVLLACRSGIEIEVAAKSTMGICMCWEIDALELAR